MKSPRVTVLMTTWKRPNYLRYSIQSVLDQTFQDWELIIVDDGSPDNTAAVAGEWEKKDKRIRYIRLEHIGRISKVSNAALREARGEFVAVLDDDDYWIDNKKLEKQIKFLETNPDYIGCGGWFHTMNAEGKKTGEVKKPVTDYAIRQVALYANPMANSTTMFRRVPAGLYDENMPQFADWDFWLRVGKQGKLYNFPEYFLSYRMWHGGASFMYQKTNVNSAFTIIQRYKNDYPHYWMALFLVSAHWVYARFPAVIRRNTDAFVSRTKKALFSGSAKAS
jgi:glycosyltransferase involved in cell wall biosynthesis